MRCRRRAQAGETPGKDGRKRLEVAERQKESVRGGCVLPPTRRRCLRLVPAEARAAITADFLARQRRGPGAAER